MREGARRGFGTGFCVRWFFAAILAYIHGALPLSLAERFERM